MIIDTINNELKEAIRTKNQLRLNVLRMLKSKILAVDARAQLPDADVQKLFKTYLGNLQEAVEQAATRPDLVDTLKQEILIVQEFLPKALSPEETEKLVKQAIAQTGASSKKEFGLVMKALMQLSPGIDGKLAKSFIENLLP